MYLKVRLFVKKHFPNAYIFLRKKFSWLIFPNRKKKAIQFTKSQFKDISINGQRFSIKIDPTNGFVDRNIYTNGVYEPDILKVIKDNTNIGDVYVDIGANIGQHLLFATSCVGSSGHTYGFEPLPQLVTQLQESIEKNDFTNRCTVYNIACSDHEGDDFIYTNNSNIGGSSLKEKQNITQTKVAIKLKPADAYLDPLEKINLIKIDTEGHEYEVFLGLQKTLKKHLPKIIFEYSPQLSTDEVTYRKIFDLLPNYTFFDLENGHRQITDVMGWSKNFSKLQTNLLCIPKQNTK